LGHIPGGELWASKSRDWLVNEGSGLMFAEKISQGEIRL